MAAVERVQMKVFVVGGTPCIAKRIDSPYFVVNDGRWWKSALQIVTLEESPHEGYYIAYEATGKKLNDYWYYHIDSFTPESVVNSSLYKLVINEA